MKHIFYFLAILLIACLSACASLPPTDESPPMEQASATLDVPVQTMTPTPTITATRLVTPTEDYSAELKQLQLAMQRTDATRSLEQLALQRSLGTATMKVVAAQFDSATATALQGYENGTATATVAQGNRRGTATAAATQTLAAHAAETQSMSLTSTVQAPITQRLQTEADFEPIRQAIIVICGALAGLIGLWFGAQLGYQWVMLVYEKRLALRGDVPSEPAAQTANQVNARLDRRDNAGFGSVDITTIPVGDVVLREVARLLTSGSRYTQAQMTGSGRPLVKDASFNTFGEWMVKCGIAEQLEDGRYSIVHPEFFRQVLERG